MKSPTDQGQTRPRSGSWSVCKRRAQHSRHDADTRTEEPPTVSDAGIAIRGLACRFPSSPSTWKFWENLEKGVNMVSHSDAHWESTLGGTLPSGKGVLENKEFFDSMFFKMSGAQAAKLDPQLRFLLELSYEALVDAGFTDLGKLRGSKTGVYVGSCFSDCHKGWLGDVKDITGYENTGCAQSMFANRLSFFYDFTGPSMNVDTACSSSLVALVEAVQAIQLGKCDMALVGGSSVTLHPGVSVAFNRLHMLSPDSACQAFSKNGNGYARSEGAAVVVLTKENCQLVLECDGTSSPYATVVGAGVNSDGFTEKGITFPNGEAQFRLYSQVREEAQVSIFDVDYVEAHGTGTQAGDGQEMSALRRAYCPDERVAAKTGTPLLVGSVKSNMGHCEGASGLAGLAKVLMSLDEGTIPGNLHYRYEDRNPTCTGLNDPVNGMKVVDETIPFPFKEQRKGLVALSSFGFGGTNAHILVEGGPRRQIAPGDGSGEGDVTKQDHCEPWKRINPVSARNATCARVLSEALLQDGVRFEAEVAMPCVNGGEFETKAFTTAGGEVFTLDSTPKAERPPIWFVFSGNGAMWGRMGYDLYHGSTVYRDVWDRCNAYLKETYSSFALEKFFREESEGVKDFSTYDAIDGVTALAAVQMGLVEVLKSVGVECDRMVGHSAGETAMGYCDGLLTLEQTLDVAYYRGHFGIKSAMQDEVGAMYAAGVSRGTAEALFEKHGVKKACVACVNDATMMTLSGSKAAMRPVLEELAEQTTGPTPILLRKLETFGVAYHSAMLDPFLPELQENLRKVIPEPKLRSAKWVSSCADDDSLEEGDPLKYLSAEYHCHNYRQPVEFLRAMQKCPKGAVVIEIGPHALFRGSAKKILGPSNHTYICPMLKDKNSLHVFQQAYAQLWQHGLLVPGGRAVTPTEAFRSRKTRQHFFQWDHAVEYPLPSLTDFMRNPGVVAGGAGTAGSGGFAVDFDLENQDKWMLDHVIDESVLFPGCGYLYAAWKAFQMHTNLQEMSAGVPKGEVSSVADVVVRNFKIPQGIVLDDSTAELSLVVKFAAGNEFEISYGGELKATGQIELLKVAPAESDADETEAWPVPFDDAPLSSATFGYPLGTVSKADFYARVARNGYNYQDRFQLVEGLGADDRWAVVRFDGDLEGGCVPALAGDGGAKFWASYLDNLLQVNLFKGLDDSTTMRVPVEIREVVIRGSNFGKCFPTDGSPSLQGAKLGTDAPKYGPHDVLVKIHEYQNKVTSPLADVSGLKLKAIPRASDKTRKSTTEVKLGEKLFFPLSQELSRASTVDGAMQVLFEYVRLNLGSSSRDVRVLDFEPFAFLGKSVVSYFGVEKFVVKFSKFDGRGENSVKAQYEQRFPGLYESFADLKPTDVRSQFNLMLIPARVYSADACRRHMAAAGFDSNAFVLVYGDEDVPSDEEIVAQEEFKAQNVAAVPVMRFAVDESDSLRTLALVRIVAGEKRVIAGEEQRDGDVFVNLLQRRSCSRSTDLDWSGSTVVNVIRPKIHALLSDPNCTRLFLVSNSDGFPGFLKCLQAEPGDESKVRGVWVQNLPASSLESLAERIASGTVPSDVVPQLPAGILQRIQALNSILVRVDVETRVVSAELRSQTTVATFPAPRGVYTVFPSPGQLDEVAFKAHPSVESDTHARVQIAYSAVNFRDVMLAYGKLDKDCLVGYSKRGDGWGLEFAGRVLSDGVPGQRVVGLSTNCIGTEVTVEKSLLLPLRDDQDLAAFATVPCVYATSYYALLIRAKLLPQESVLIHAGAGGVGQAALNICLRRQDPASVFATCSAKKRAYLLATFGPLGLRAENIGNSRDASFEQLVMERTKGRGVDVVLNSLDGALLQASWRCMAPFGRFCEIGKVDMMQNTGLPMGVFLWNVSYMGIDLDQILAMPAAWDQVRSLLVDGLESGEVQPIGSRVFGASEITEAFRFLGSGAAIGKVLIKFEAEGTSRAIRASIPNFASRGVFLVVGGLGGFGLEFAQWCASRGAAKVILSSRGKLKSATQARAIQKMRTVGCEAVVCNVDFTDYANVVRFLEETQISGFFNLGAVLADGLFHSQTPESWELPCLAKVAVADNFDRALSALEVRLDHFVTWSSVSAGHGNAGQTNYGYANSTLDAIARRRVARGEAGLSIQWGAIGDVGLLAKTKATGNVSVAYVPLPIASCLAELERLLCAGSTGVCEVYASSTRSKADGDRGGTSLPLKVAAVIGVAKNAADVWEKTFDSLGVDSLQIMEIQNTVKKVTGVKVAVDKLSKMSLKALAEIPRAGKVDGPHPIPHDQGRVDSGVDLFGFKDKSRTIRDASTVDSAVGLSSMSSGDLSRMNA